MSIAKTTIYLATPCYGGLAYVDYMRGVLALGPQCAARGIGLDLRIGAGEALIGRGRATVMARFLGSGATHLLFVDADVGFEPQAVFRLLDSGFDVVGGIYPRKAPRGGDEVDELPAGATMRQGDFRTVASLGAGFLLISREAANRMVEGYPRLRARLGDLKGAGVAEAAMVFDSFIDPDTRRYLADHQAFCRRWRDLGRLVWADSSSRLTHVGSGAVTTKPPPTSLDRSAAQALWREAEALLTEGRLETSEQVLRSLLAGGATGPDVQYMLGYALLAQGRYAEGFQRYEARRNIPAFRIALPPISAQPWRGEPLAGKRLLIWPEQGLGDVIMFSRFALGLANIGAFVTMVVPSPLARLFAGTAVEILSMGAPIELQGYDFHVLAGDLPARCGADVNSLPPPWPIQAAPADRHGRIGVATRGDPKHANDAQRSLPPDLAAALLALPETISLLPEDTGATDFQATANLIAGLDLVITVDTAIAHLAASMGKPTWILLPHLRTDWRWMRGRDDSPWYPSVKLFRQPATGQWSEVIQAVTRRASQGAHVG